MLVIQSGLINSGVAVASWISFGTLFANSSAQWRVPVAMQLVFSTIVLIACMFLPETPRWLASHGKFEEARTVLAQLRDVPNTDKVVDGQLQEIVNNVQSDANKSTGWYDTFRNRTPMRNLHRVVLGLGPYMMNQWSGINAITYYLTYTLQKYLDFSPNMALILASVASTPLAQRPLTPANAHFCQAFTQYSILSFPPYFYIDRIGRRWTIMLSSIGCSLCMVVVAGCLLEQTYARSAAAVAFMFLFIDSFGLGILPVSWSYSSEIQPLTTRNTANAVGVAGRKCTESLLILVGLSAVG